MFCPVTFPGQRGSRQTVTRVFHVQRQISNHKIIFIKLSCLVDLTIKTAEMMFEDMKLFCSSLNNDCLSVDTLGGTNCGQKAEQEG